MLKKSFLLSVLAAAAVLPLSADVVLVDNGAAKSSIVFDAEDKRIEKYALIMNDYIEASSGAVLPVNKSGNTAVVKLVIAPKQHSDIEEFSFTFPDKNTVVISGGSENGLKFGVYRFLEKYLGLRRLFPGKLGEHLPINKTISIPEKPYTDKPAYLSRYLGSGAYTAQTREYYDWVRSLGSNNPRIYMGHYLFALLPQEKYGKTNPEFYPEFNGKRVVPQPGQRTFWQPCFTAPGVAEAAAENAIKRLDNGFKNDLGGVNIANDDPRRRTVSVGVNDAGGYCTCTRCNQVNGNSVNYAGLQSKSASYVAFINKVANIVTAKYPDCRIPFLAYAAVAEIPAGTGKLNKRLVPELDYDSMYTADPVLRDNFRRVFKAWSNSVEELALGDYVYGQPFVLPRVNFSTCSEQIIWSYENGARHYYGECYPGDEWVEGPKVYLIIKLLWNPALDKEALLKEWYECCVGKKAAPYMQQYFENLEKFWTKDVVKTAWFQEKRVYPSFGKTDYLEAYTPEALYKNEELLKKCVALAETPQQKARAEYFYKLFMKRKPVIEAFWKAQAVRNEAAKLNFSDPVYVADFDPEPRHVSHWQRAKRNAKFLRDKTGGINNSECLLIDADGAVFGPSLYEVRIPVKSKRSFRITVKCRAESDLGDKAVVNIQTYWRTPQGEMLPSTYRVTEILPRPYDDHWRTVTVYTTTPREGDLRLCIGMNVTEANKGKVRFDDLRVDATPELLPEEDKYTEILLNDTFIRPRDRWAMWQSGKDKALKFDFEKNGVDEKSGSIAIDSADDKSRSAGIYVKDVPCAGKRKVLISSMIKVAENTDRDAVVRISTTLLDGSKKAISGAGYFYADHPEVRDGKWRRVAFIAEVPENAKFIRLSLASRRAAPGKVWFDDVQIKSIP